MNILGISAYYHDSAACLLQSGRIVAAAEEERFSRLKHDGRFPSAAITYCLGQAGLQPRDIDYVVYYEKTFLKFERILNTYMAYAPHGLSQALVSLPVWVKEKIWIKDAICRALPDSGPILFTNHHLAHAASAFYPSPYDEAAYLTIDGVGERSTTTFGIGEGKRLTPLGELSFPHSLGLLYSAFTTYLGFRANSDEYKLMGLAPYGVPRFQGMILDHLVDLKDDGSFRLNMEYFSYPTGISMTGERFHSLFGGPPRKAGTSLTQREMDIARSVQAVAEEMVLRMARHVHRETAKESLCLAGGVALNCVANGRLLREGPFKNIWVQPAAGDAGAALGSALWGWHHCLEMERFTLPVGDSMQGALLGPSFTEREIADCLDRAGARYERLEADRLLTQTADLLASGKVVGWFQGRMEFGPRALGNRSILADPRNSMMQSIVNRKIKFREDFRPFAPAILESQCQEYFGLDAPSPYMLLVAPLQSSRLRSLTEQEKILTGLDRLKITRSEIPAVTHVDNSARVQTVSEDRNPLFYRLLRAFESRTGCPLLLNTSFNVSEEPIVCRPEEAYRCFLKTDLDFLIMGPYLMERRAQPSEIPQGKVGAQSIMPNYDDRKMKSEHLPSRLRLFLFALFAIALSLCFYLTGTVFFFLPAAVGSFSLFGVLFPRPFAVVYRQWLAIGTVAAKMATRILLIVFYFLALCPMSWLARLLGEKFLSYGPEKDRSSYWEPSVVPECGLSGGLKQY